MKKGFLVLLATVFLLACYVPVSAADWDLYGSARVTTFWTDFSEERGDTTELNHTLQPNSRIGAFVNAGDIGGRFEYGTGGGNANIRLLYADFPLGPGKLLVGQHYGPYGIGSFISTRVIDTDAGLLQFIPYSGRVPLVQYTVNDFKIALARANEVGNPEVQLPQLQASYDLNLVEGLRLNLAGIFQSYDVDGGDGDTLNAWAAGFNARFTMMDPVYVNLGGFYGQNVADFGQWSINNSSSMIDNGDVEDTDTFAVGLVLGTQLPTMRIEGGVGYVNSENDNWVEDDEVIIYYAQANIPIVGGASITPEIGFKDFQDNPDGTDAGDEFYVGLQWRVDF